MPARRPFLLDLEVKPTEVGSITQEDLDEALWALQVKGATGRLNQEVFAACLVAIVKHLKARGSYQAVELPPDQLFDDAATVENVTS